MHGLMDLPLFALCFVFLLFTFSFLLLVKVPHFEAHKASIIRDQPPPVYLYFVSPAVTAGRRYSASEAVSSETSERSESSDLSAKGGLH